MLLASQTLRTRLQPPNTEEKRVSGPNLANKSSNSLEEAERLAEVQLVNIQKELALRSKPHRPQELCTTDDYKPKFRILLVRHGLSMANVDKNLYKTMADHVIPLSESAIAEATAAGKRIKDWLWLVHNPLS